MTLTVWCFSFWNTGIIFLSTDTQHVQPKQYRWFSLGLRSSTMQLGLRLLLGEWFIVISTVLPHFMHMWQIGPNLSSRIRWCLGLASVRLQWCLLWRFICVCVCVRACEWSSGPCMWDRSLLNSCYFCQLRYPKPWDLSTVTRTHQWCLQCLPELCAVAWLDPSPALVMSLSFSVGLLISWLFLWRLKLCGFINRHA